MLEKNFQLLSFNIKLSFYLPNVLNILANSKKLATGKYLLGVIKISKWQKTSKCHKTKRHAIHIKQKCILLLKKTIFL